MFVRTVSELERNVESQINKLDELTIISRKRAIHISEFHLVSAEEAAVAEATFAQNYFRKYIAPYND